MTEELIAALQGIQHELQRINQTLSAIVSSQTRPSQSREPLKGPSRKEGGYARSEMSAPRTMRSREEDSSFPKRKGLTDSPQKSKEWGKGKPTARKSATGNLKSGYPKKKPYSK